MRKCRSCGYLLLGEGETCGRCGAPLAVVTVGAAAGPATVAAPPAAPPAPPAPPAPVRAVASIPGLAPAPAPVPPPPGGAPVPAQPLPALRETWAPVAISAPHSEPRSKKLGLTVLSVVIAIVVGAAVMHLRSDPLPPGTSAFASGGGVTYTSPDGAFQVQLPKAPEMQQEQIPINGTTETLYTAVAGTDDYEIGGGSMALPASVSPAQASAALDTVLTGAIKSVNGKVSHRTVTSRGTLPAIVGEFKDSHGYAARMMVVMSNSSLIVLLVHAKSGVDRLYKALDASLIIR